VLRQFYGSFFVLKEVRGNPVRDSTHKRKLGEKIMKKVCPCCLHIFDNTLIDYCPLNDCCSAELVELDEMLVDVIIQFWAIGIGTKYCCAGHLYEERFRPYIMFEDIWDDEFLLSFDEFRGLLVEVASKSKDIEIGSISSVEDSQTLIVSGGGTHTEDKKQLLVKQTEFISFLYDVVAELHRLICENCKNRGEGVA
jgi:hypothetical protein